MSLESGLNLLWAAGALFVFTALYLSKAWHQTSGWGRIRQFVAAVIISVALLPSVSVSDDEIWFSFLLSHAEKNGASGTLPEDAKEKADLHLIRLLQTLEQIEVPGLYSIFVSVIFIAFVTLLVLPLSGRDLLGRPGRSPPISSYSVA